MKDELINNLQSKSINDLKELEKIVDIAIKQLDTLLNKDEKNDK